MQTQRINIDLVVPNEGQLPGVPTNPRLWRRKELSDLKKSLQETPELFEARPILVYPLEGKYVVLGGNMRLNAAISLKYKEVPCIVFPEDTPTEKLKEIVIKDNGSFGDWDYDLLANEWDDLPLTDWGVPAWDTNVSETEETQENEGGTKLNEVVVLFPTRESGERFVSTYEDELSQMYGAIVTTKF